MTKSATWAWALFCAVLGVWGVAWMLGGGDPPSHGLAGDGVGEPTPDRISGDAPAPGRSSIELVRTEGPEPEPVSRAAARQAELATMSETFREGVFLVAIREAGYLCYNLVSSGTSGGDDPLWTVTCDDALGYVIAVDAAGELIVDPTPIGDGARDWQLPEGQFTDPNRPRLPIE